MNGICVRSVGLSILLAAVSFSSMAQRASQPAHVANSLPTDWSHRHMIFSVPSTAEKAGRIQRSTRYQQQLARQEQHSGGVVHKPTAAEIRYWRRHRRHHRGRRMHRDWSVDLGLGATVGAGMYPAKFSFDLNNATCGLVTPPAIPDYVVFGTSVHGSLTQGTIVALTNLYAGCGGQVPGDYWSYDTTGQVLTSPVLSLDGTQVAFTQTTGGVASLAILKWARFDGFINSPTPLTPLPPSAYFGCTAPCMTTLPLFGDDTMSPVYYDYDSDTAYVGDDSGALHRFTSVFSGTPTESFNGFWPVGLTGSKLTGPVYDSVSGNVFVGGQDGILFRVNDANQTVNITQLVFGFGFTEGPIVDSTAGLLYAFSSSGNSGSPASVVQLSTSFSDFDPGTAVPVGAASVSGTPLYDGAFDHDYMNNSGTGDLWVCGNPGGFPTLYQIPIVNYAMGAPRTGPPLGTTSQVPCSPTTVVYNDLLQGAGLPQEWAFASVQGAGQPTPCGGFACVMNLKVTTWQPNTVYNVGQEILDSNLSIQVAETPLSTSGATPPAWNSATFSTTVDNAVHWRSQGPLSTQTPGSWGVNTNYPGGTLIIDTNNNIEIESLIGGGTTGVTQPSWSLTEGTIISDGSVLWYNLGANPVAALPASGGTSGIIIDNIVNNPGGSQVYFTNLQDFGCFTSGGTGGCAVQASQQDLQ